MDEAHGSWGQMGTEIACKTWLSGGRLITNKKTWFAHMFRTQPGFGFPYPNHGADKARQYSQDLWFNNKWPEAIHTLKWVIQKFAPVPGWEDYANGHSRPIEKVIIPEAKPQLPNNIVETKEPPPDKPIVAYKPRNGQKGIVYYTDNRLEQRIMISVQNQLLSLGYPIVSVSLQPLDFGQNIVYKGE